MSYISIFVAPFLTVFLILSTALSAMQVELAVQDLDGPSTGIWSAFSRASRVFSIGVLLLVALVLFMMVTVAMFAVIHEQLFAWRLLRHKNRKEAFEKSKSAVV
jgi:ABC-type multidrug transport system fused ATPase/permease subunit